MPDPHQPQSDAQLLRLLADGELAGDDLVRARALLAGNEAPGASASQQVEDEHRLREAVGRVMGEAVAPEALRAHIEHSLTELGAPASIAGRIGHGGIATSPRRGRWAFSGLFASPQRANIAAVAAVLALIVGAVLFGIYGRPIDDVPPPQSVDVVGNVAQYVRSEHGQCTTSLEHIQRETTWHTLDDAELGMTEALGAPVRAFDLSELGYAFVGAGRGQMPLEQQPSGHLMYRKSVNGRPGPMVSVFVAPVRGCCKSICDGLLPGVWMAANGSGTRKVVYSTDSRLVYFLVCCDERDVARVGQAISRAQASGSR